MRYSKRAVAMVIVCSLAVSSGFLPASADPAGTPAGPARDIAETIAAGNDHSCALLENGTIKCWGANSTGQLGLGDTTGRGDNTGDMGDNLPIIDLGTGRTATAITAGSNHTCALLDNESVKCWGNNSSGQLGVGDSTGRGDDTGEMGDNLPTTDLGTGRTAVAITAARNHTCALLDNESVKCWGQNGYGQLGLENSVDRGDDTGEMGDNLPTTDLGTGRTAVAIAAGDYHTCAVLDNNTAKCWGYNSGGQLGLGDTDRRGNNTGDMGDNLPTIDLGTGALTGIPPTTTVAPPTTTIPDGGPQPVGFDLDGLDPIALSMWGVVGHGESSSQQEVRVWDFEQIGDRIFVAGSFTHVQQDGVSVPIRQSYLAAFDVDSGVYLPEFAPVFDRTIYDLEVYDGRLLVGGEFTSVNGVTRRGLVGLDPVTGETDASMPFATNRPFSNTRPAIVRTLTVDGDMLYVAGNFNYLLNNAAGSQSRAYGIGRVNLGSSTIDQAWRPRTTGSGIWDLTVDKDRGRVSFVGFFSAVDAMPDTDLMATVSEIDGVPIAGLAQLPSRGTLDATVAIVYANDKLFVGGDQHIMQVLRADTNVEIGYHETGYDCTNVGVAEGCKLIAGGDFQVLELIGGYVLGGCHCLGARRQYEQFAHLVHYNTFDDRYDRDKFVIPIDAVTGGDGSDWSPDRGKAIGGTWAIMADDNGCLYVGGDYSKKGPLGSSRWLGGFAKYCAGGEQLAISAIFSASTTVVVSWTEPTTPSPIDSYRIYRDGTFIGTTTRLSYTDSGLTENDAHDYSVEAVDINGNISPRSDAVTITVAGLDTSAPAAPTNVALTAADDTTATFSWTESTDDQRVKTYLIYRDYRYIGRVAADGPLTFTDANLTPNQTYRYHVRAKDYGANVSPPSSILLVTTSDGSPPDTTPPTAPTALVADEVDGSVTLSWAPSSDNDSGVKAYLIYRDFVYIGRTFANAAPQLTDTNVTNDTTYRYHVRAKDYAGNVSSPSTPIFATPTTP